MTKANEPAFPVTVVGKVKRTLYLDDDIGETLDDVEVTEVGGLTQREYFAAMAMQGLAAFPGTIMGAETVSPKQLCSRAVEYADALIAELQKQPEKE